jgi:sugar/nucleoside kinase (ribokinase family)
MTHSETIRPVLCVGDLVLDIVSTPVDRLPAPGESVLTDTIAVFPGGNALNTAVALCRMGDPVTMAGVLGDDALGQILLDQLTPLGLHVGGVTRKAGGKTPTTFILRAVGEDRRFISTLGVGAEFTGEAIDWDLIPSEGIVLIGGYLKLPAWDPQILMAFLREARRRKCQIVFNVCVVQNNGVDPRGCLDLLPAVDVFVPNEDEARVITGVSDVARQAECLRRAGARCVVITRGEAGLYADDGRHILTMGAYDVPVLDPSGCGDCFLAGLVAALRRDMDMEAILQYGSAVGALGAAALGCTGGVPSFAEVRRFLEVHRVRITREPSR